MDRFDYLHENYTRALGFIRVAQAIVSSYIETHPQTPKVHFSPDYIANDGDGTGSIHWSYPTDLLTILDAFPPSLDMATAATKEVPGDVYPAWVHGWCGESGKVYSRVSWYTPINGVATYMDMSITTPKLQRDQKGDEWTIKAPHLTQHLLYHGDGTFRRFALWIGSESGAMGLKDLLEDPYPASAPDLPIVTAEPELIPG